MNKPLNLIFALVITVFFSSCATIVGGSKYNAKVIVSGHTNAKIEYNGVVRGTGEASFKVKRKEANQLSITVSQDGCPSQTTNFTKRKFRGGTLVGSILGWTGAIGSFPIPWGVIVDGATGSWWKPDDSEFGITKQNYKNYYYTINYKNCDDSNDTSKPLKTTEKVEYLRELKKMLDEGVITQEEFEREKKKVLEGKN